MIENVCMAPDCRSTAGSNGWLCDWCYAQTGDEFHCHAPGCDTEINKDRRARPSVFCEAHMRQAEAIRLEKAAQFCQAPFCRNYRSMGDYCAVHGVD